MTILIPRALAVGTPFLSGPGIADIPCLLAAEKRKTSSTASSAFSIASSSRGELAVITERKG